MNILITGGSSGLGRVLVERLSRNDDSHVIFTYRSGKETADSLCASRANVEYIKCDFTQPEDIDRLIGQLPQWDIDVLINNAWVGSPNGTYFHKTAIEDFNAAFQWNVIPVVQLTQACITIFRKKKHGKIINVMTSYLLDLPPVGFSIYSATKAYIHQLSKCWCKENQRFNITCNCVMPDYMQTGFANIDERIIEQMRAAHPLRRILRPEEVAEAIVFLVQASEQVNGVSIPITAAQHILY